MTQENGKIAGHWNVVETIADKEEYAGKRG